MALVALFAIALILFFNPREKDITVNPDENKPGEVTFYMILPEGTEASQIPEGAIEIEGCGIEYAVPVSSINGDVSLQGTLNSLFSIKETVYPGTDYINTLYASNLTATVFDGIEPVEVNLNGEIMMGGTCDTPRFKAQIEETIKRYIGNRQSFQINIKGDPDAWDCLGDESGMCN